MDKGTRPARPIAETRIVKEGRGAHGQTRPEPSSGIKDLTSESREKKAWPDTQLPFEGRPQVLSNLEDEAEGAESQTGFEPKAQGGIRCALALRAEEPGMTMDTHSPVSMRVPMLLFRLALGAKKEHAKAQCEAEHVAIWSHGIPISRVSAVRNSKWMMGMPSILGMLA
jgi:hypothetical protein